MIAEKESINGNSITIDCTSINNYSKLTVDNFLFDIISATYFGGGTQGVRGINKSYNSSTGTLTIEMTSGDHINLIIDIYLVK